jgi:hypothetical protein
MQFTTHIAIPDGARVRRANLVPITEYAVRMCGDGVSLNYSMTAGDIVATGHSYREFIEGLQQLQNEVQALQINMHSHPSAESLEIHRGVSLNMGKRPTIAVTADERAWLDEASTAMRAEVAQRFPKTVRSRIREIPVWIPVLLLVAGTLGAVGAATNLVAGNAQVAFVALLLNVIAVALVLIRFREAAPRFSLYEAQTVAWYDRPAVRVALTILSLLSGALAIIQFARTLVASP